MASIKTRTRKDGVKTWAVLYRIKDAAGNTRESSTTYPTRSAAEALAELIDRVGVTEALRLKNLPTAPRPIKAPTVAAWTAHHIEHLTGVNRNTRNDRRAVLRLAIEGSALGGIPINEVARTDVERWVNELEDTGTLKSSSIRNRLDLLVAAFNRAVREHKIPSNPAHGITCSRDEQQERIALTHNEFQTVLTVMPEHYRLFVAFLVETGCRFNEATALRPGDVNREAGTVRIARTWRRIHGRGADHVGEWEIGDVKTKNSRRTIKVRTALLDQLDYRHEYLFTNTNGDPIRHGTFRSGTWEYRLRKAVADGTLPKHRKPRLHDLRHTHASWLIDAKVSPLVIQKRLGHNDIRVTFNTYGHLMDAADDSALAALDAVLGVE